MLEKMIMYAMVKDEQHERIWEIARAVWNPEKSKYERHFVTEFIYFFTTFFWGFVLHILLKVKTRRDEWREIRNDYIQKFPNSSRWSQWWNPTYIILYGWIYGVKVDVNIRTGKHIFRV